MSIRVYKLTSTKTTDVYIGSTRSTLAKRSAKHKNDFKRFATGKREGYVSFFKLYSEGPEHVRIELVEETDDAAREGYHIQNTPNCINERIAGRTQRQYYLDNKAREDARVNQWKKDNPEKAIAIKQRYYEKVKVKEQCECGMQYMLKHKKRHLESKGHRDRMNGVQPETLEQRNAKYNARKREKVPCPQCNKEMAKASLARHIKKQH
jgi:hypothetical protein